MTTTPITIPITLTDQQWHDLSNYAGLLLLRSAVRGMELTAWERVLLEIAKTAKEYEMSEVQA